MEQELGSGDRLWSLVGRSALDERRYFDIRGEDRGFYKPRGGGKEVEERMSDGLFMKCKVMPSGE